MKTPANALSERLLQALSRIQYGSIAITTPDGKKLFFRGKEEGAHATLTIHDWKAVRNVAMRGDIALGEDYIAGLWDTDSVEALLTLFLSNIDALEDFRDGDWLRRIGFNIYNRILRRNSRAGSRNNIRAHYDVGNDFYKLWLDDTMTYSSALYKKPADTLEVAQKQKYGRILDRIDGDNVLEIGCGWGGFAEQASNSNRKVTGLTISPAQHAFAQRRLKGRADIRLEDYRDTGGTFDSIVSIEMFEAVGERYWPLYFQRVSERLKRGGSAVVQTITMRNDLFARYRANSDFIRHYVFPGGMLPSQEKFAESAAAAGLKCVDTFAFGQDYARTLREWLVRFEEKKSEIYALGYSESFVRNWRFYLGTCAAAFAVGRTDVMQVEMKHA